MILKRNLIAQLQLSLEFPVEMSDSVAEVLQGEYETGYHGSNLTILDLGANVGSFSLWANSRWPNSTIHSYEPNPDTFALLSKNVSRLPNIITHNQAVAIETTQSQPFFSRFAGDGEAGLVSYMKQTFHAISVDHVQTVSTIAASKLPACDIVKIDIEGAEADIIENMKTERISLLLMEYQNIKNKKRILKHLSSNFTLEYEDTLPWKSLLPGSQYRASLENDYYGHLFMVNKNVGRMKKIFRV